MEQTPTMNEREKPPSTAYAQGEAAKAAGNPVKIPAMTFPTPPTSFSIPLPKLLAGSKKYTVVIAIMVMAPLMMGIMEWASFSQDIVIWFQDICREVIRFYIPAQAGVDGLKVLRGKK